ncbi:MAG: response regulator [Desulfobacula sp.]|jgi:PAS domain S-box-containing protein
MTQKKTILIIDDEVSIRDSLKSFFEDEDYHVFSAKDGDEGLHTYFNEKIDLVLTDLRMPGKDGIEVMRIIHAHEPDIPMIVVSGAGQKEDIINALRMGARDYITKPIDDLDKISHTIRQVLENKRLSDENKRYRAQLEKSEAKYRTITENIAEGVFTVDEEENFNYSNQAFSTMIGYTDKELLKKNLEDVSTKKSFHIIRQQTLNRKAGVISTYEIEMIDSKNNILHVELACSPVFSEHNVYQGAIAVARNITKLVELKKKFQKYLLREDSASKGVTPICASCKSIRIEDNSWIQVEEYFPHIVFSHGICPACCSKLYPEFNLSEPETKI